MRGLDPRINHVRKIYAKPMDPRVKPAGDGGGWTSTDSNRPGTAIAASARQPPPPRRDHAEAEPSASSAGLFSPGHIVDGNGCMQFDDSKSGNNLETQPGQPPAVVANIPERQGVTGHNVRYVLFFGIAAVVIAFAAILVSYFD